MKKSGARVILIKEIIFKFIDVWIKILILLNVLIKYIDLSAIN